MQPTLKYIQKLNEIYVTMKKNYDTLKKMFHNHSVIKQKVILSEQFLIDVYKLILQETEEIEVKREFNKITKGFKNGKK